MEAAAGPAGEGRQRLPGGWRGAEDAWVRVTGYLFPTLLYANTSFERLIYQQPAELLLNVL